MAEKQFFFFFFHHGIGRSPVTVSKEHFLDLPFTSLSNRLVLPNFHGLYVIWHSVHISNPSLYVFCNTILDTKNVLTDRNKLIPDANILLRCFFTGSQISEPYSNSGTNITLVILFLLIVPIRFGCWISYRLF